MKNIQVCGQNLLMLLNNVLDLARIENDKTEMEYSVSDVEKDFRNCIAMFRNQADSKNQTLTVTTHLLHPYIYADVPHLTEVCTNLVSNAVKYTGTGGTIRCDVTQKPCEKRAGAIRWSRLPITASACRRSSSSVSLSRLNGNARPPSARWKAAASGWAS